MYIGWVKNLRHELYGESVFTSFRTFDGKVFEFQRHVWRLLEGVRLVYLMGNLRMSEFESLFLKNFNSLEIFKQSPNHYFRLTITSHGDTSLVQTHFDPKDLRLSVLLRKIENESLSPIALRSCPSPYSKNYVPIKTGSYFQNLHFKRHAILEGFDDALFCHEELITEATSSNIIFQKGGEFWLPSGGYFLKGVTLTLFKKYCSFKKIKFCETDIYLEDLVSIEKVYTLNSVQLVRAVERIDSKSFEVDKLGLLEKNFLSFCKTYKGERISDE